MVSKLIIKNISPTTTFVGSTRLKPQESFKMECELSPIHARGIRFLYIKKVIEIVEGLETIQPVWDEIDRQIKEGKARPTLTDKLTDVARAQMEGKDIYQASKEEAKETVKEVAKEAIKEAAKEAAREETSIAEAVAQPAEEVVAQPVEEVVAQPAEETVEQPVEEVAEQPVKSRKKSK